MFNYILNTLEASAASHGYVTQGAVPVEKLSANSICSNKTLSGYLCPSRTGAAAGISCPHGPNPLWFTHSAFPLQLG